MSSELKNKKSGCIWGIISLLIIPFLLFSWSLFSEITLLIALTWENESVADAVEPIVEDLLLLSEELVSLGNPGLLNSVPNFERVCKL